MKRHERKVFGRACLLVLVIVCFTMVGCTATQIRQAKIAVRDFAKSLVAVQAVFETAGGDGFIDKPDLDTAEGIFDDLSQVGKEVTANLRASNQQGALAALDRALASLDNLDAQGATRIKNADKQAAAHLAIQALRSLIETAQAFLQ